MFKKFVYVVNNMPLSGKWAVRKFAHIYWSATTPSRKMSSFLQLMFLLILSILGHGFISFIGFKAFSLSQNIIFNIVFISFGLFNLLAVIAQIHLFFRAIRRLFKKLPKTERKVVEINASEGNISLIITFLGQIIFLIMYFISKLQ